MTQDTSQQAYQSIKPKIPTQRERLLNLLDNHPNGLILEEISELLNERDNSISPRFAPMIRDGLIRVDGTRKNKRGRNQNVLIKVKEAA